MNTDAIKNINQREISRGGVIHKRWLENKDFVYFVNEESVYMFRKKDNSLASDNFFAEDALFEDMKTKNYTWASKDALYSIQQIEKENEKN